jgi:hypothetical protein
MVSLISFAGVSHPNSKWGVRFFNWSHGATTGSADTSVFIQPDIYLGGLEEGFGSIRLGLVGSVPSSHTT